ncbi:hypothetical protein LTS10_005390 [Elasticomyces elasticus]|nr:hypothetical protein LTS10_005390 [Elasticomyces elasticus]
MPRSKRPLAESDPNIEPSAKRSTASEKQSRGKGEQSDNDHEEENAQLDAIPPNAYLCTSQPFWDFRQEHRGERKFSNDPNPPSMLRKAFYNDKTKDRYFLKPASNFPDWKWIMTKSAWYAYDLLRRKTTYCDPDYFGAMHFYSHYHNWGVNHLLDQQMIEFNRVYTNKNIDGMWSVVSAVAHWLDSEVSLGEPTVMVLIGTDDGDGVCERVKAAGCMFLTALDAVEREGELQARSERFRDLELVMSLWLNWSWGLDEYCIGQEGECEWQRSIVGYAKAHDRDLSESGGGVGLPCRKVLYALRDIEPLKAGGKKAGRWHWPKTFKTLKARHFLSNKDAYDVTKMTSAQRAEMAYDGKDPLADAPEDALRGNLLCFHFSSLGLWSGRSAMESMSRETQLPVEIWLLIFHLNSDALHLWTQGRLVSKTWRQRIFTAFADTYLADRKTMCIRFSLDPIPIPNFTTTLQRPIMLVMTFHHFDSLDSDRCVFTPDQIFANNLTRDLNFSTQNGRFDHWVESIFRYGGTTARNLPPYTIYNLAGSAKDTTLPGFRVDIMRREMSFLWPEMLSLFFVDERRKVAMKVYDGNRKAIWYGQIYGRMWWVSKQFALEYFLWMLDLLRKDNEELRKANEDLRKDNKKLREDGEGSVNDNEESIGKKDGSVSSEDESDPLDAFQPTDYLCIDRPCWHFEQEHSNSEEREDSIKIHEAYHSDPQTEARWLKPASEYPDWKWVMMKDAYSRSDDLRTKASYCDSEKDFDMYIYNDFHAYGVTEVLDSQLLAFNTAYNKKDTDQMWIIASAVAHWRSPEDTNMVLISGDGDKATPRVEACGRMFLIALEAVEREGELKAESRFRDLGLVMSLNLKWCADLLQYGIGEEGQCDWRKEVVGYAKAAGVDLTEAWASAEARKAIEEFKHVEAIQAGGGKATKWEWPKTFKELGGEKRGFGTNNQYDITKWTRQERAAKCYKGKDPLADVPVKILKSDGIAFQ